MVHNRYIEIPDQGPMLKAHMSDLRTIAGLEAP